MPWHYLEKRFSNDSLRFVRILLRILLGQFLINKGSKGNPQNSCICQIHPQSIVGRTFDCQENAVKSAWSAFSTSLSVEVNLT